MPIPRDADNWAHPVERLTVHDASPGARAGNVDGRRVTGPIQGFGQLWQKTYSVALGEVSPEEVVATWKDHYDDFWPTNSRFYAPLSGIRPGEVGLISAVTGPVQLSTGVLVIYADATSFAFMTPQGHPFSGMITFSAERDAVGTVAQVQLLIRPSDPLFDLAFGIASSRMEDRMWQQTLQALAMRFGSAEPVVTVVTRVDKRRQWRHFGNIRHSAMLRPGRRRRR